MTQQFRKKPVVITALQLTPENFDECIGFVGAENITDGTNRDECYIGLHTLEGEFGAHSGDWIIKGVQGEFYPCKPDIFEATYELVTDTQ